MFVFLVNLDGRVSVNCRQTIQSELGSVEAQGISKPSPAGLLTHDLDIWVSQAKGPELKPTLGDGSGNGSWALPDEELLFQRYAPQPHHLERF